MLVAALTLALLTDVRSIRALHPERARTAMPLHVRGIVTNLSGWRSSFFLLDESGGISVDRRDTAVVTPGDEVEIDGVTAPGLFAPVILSDRIRIIGHRVLPPAPLVHFDEIAWGQKDAQWIAVHGVVRAAAIDWSWGRRVLFLTLDLGVGSVEVRVHDFDIRDPSTLVDAEVTAHGVCGTNFNDRRQFVGLRLFVNRLSDVRIDRAPPPDPFGMPPQPISSILQFTSLDSVRHRMKVEGVVSDQLPGRLLCIQNGNEGVCAETTQKTIVSLGTSVEVVGFAAPGSYSPILQAANFRPGGHPVPPQIVDVRAGDVIRRDRNMFLAAPYDGLLVRVQGELIQQVADSGGAVLLLRDGIAFRARMARSGKSLEPGMMLRLTGVCSVRADERREPQSFEIELRTPADIEVVAAPPWWNLHHTIEALAIAVAIALAMGAWTVVRQRTFARVAATAREWTSTFDAAPNPILVADAALRIGRANRAASELLRRAVRDVVGLSLHELEGEPWRTVAALCERQADVTVEVSGPERTWDLSLTVQEGEAASDRRHIIMLRDVTATRELQKSLQRAETMSAMGTLVAGVLHEVRNPLFSISAAVDTLEARTNSQIVAHYVERLRHDVGRLRKIMSDLLEYGRPHVLNVIDSPLSSIASAAVALTLPVAQIANVAIDVGPSQVRVRVDSDRMRQVFHNVIENAVQHTPAGGRVRVRVHEETRRGVPWVIAAVEDEGPGFIAADLHQIFEPFFTRRRGGTGLGLSIVRKIVEEHGGTVEAANRPGGGAVVFIALRA